MTQKSTYCTIKRQEQTYPNNSTHKEKYIQERKDTEERIYHQMAKYKKKNEDLVMSEDI